jgi:hypothetical protein
MQKDSKHTRATYDNDYDGVNNKHDDISSTTPTSSINSPITIFSNRVTILTIRQYLHILSYTC